MELYATFGVLGLIAGVLSIAWSAVMISRGL